MEEEATFNKTEVSIVSADSIDSSLLKAFYAEAYPGREVHLQENWQWINRVTFRDNKIPLVAHYRGKVIAHAGMIPTTIMLGKDTYTAAWFVDFFVLPEFQRYGLGRMLTEAWMALSDIHLTFCNEKSYGLFKRLGWKESFKTYLITNYIDPFSHPRLHCRFPHTLQLFTRRLLLPFFYLFYRVHGHRDLETHLSKVDEGSLDLLMNTHQRLDGVAIPERDFEYLRWRILRSPHKGHYFIYRSNGFSALLFFDYKSSCIDILSISNSAEQRALREMICSLAIFALKNDVARIRFLTSEKRLAEYLARNTVAFVRTPRFAYSSGKNSVVATLAHVAWQFDLLDSDFERF